MASKGYRNLWIMAIGLIAVFVIATVIAPQLTGHGNSTSGNGWNTDMPSGEAIFQAPTMTLSASAPTVNQLVNISVRAAPVADTTGKGGNYAWIFQLEGANGQGSVADLRYNNGVDTVVWSQGSKGALVGVGPRFIQGPGAASVSASSSLSLAISEANTYTLKTWIATASKASDIDPGNYTSVSPMATTIITMEKPTDASVSVNQQMSGPSTVTMSNWSSFSISSTAAASGRWSEPIATYIAIEKKGIKSLDVSVRMDTGKGYSFPDKKVVGDSLVVQLVTKTPLTGRTDPESQSWTTTFELSFATAGNYTLVSYAKNDNTGVEITAQQTSKDIEVQGTVVTPPVQPPPVDPNSTNGTNSTVVNQNSTPVAAPTDNTSTVEQAANGNGSNRSSK